MYYTKPAQGALFANSVQRPPPLVVVVGTHAPCGAFVATSASERSKQAPTEAEWYCAHIILRFLFACMGGHSKHNASVVAIGPRLAAAPCIMIAQHPSQWHWHAPCMADTLLQPSASMHM